MSNQVYYSLRSHSPYQGTIQVVEVDGFRALSQDGETWRIRLRAAQGQRAVHSVWRDGAEMDIPFASARAGFEALFNHPPTPFPMVDSLELWLLDAVQATPLALLRSLSPRDEPPAVTDVDWIAGFRDEESFYAPSLAGSQTAGADKRTYIPHSEVLTRCVRSAAGARPMTQWFHRQHDGSGAGISGHNLPNELESRALKKDQFPRFLLREDWSDEMQTLLVSDYHSWQAPYLLTHSTHSIEARNWLERAACQQAERLYSVRRLLPEILNKDLIEAAMVEAVIRRTNIA